MIVIRYLTNAGDEYWCSVHRTILDIVIFIVSPEEISISVCGSGIAIKSSPGIKVLSWTGFFFTYEGKYITNLSANE